MISPDIFKNIKNPGEAAALLAFQSSEFEQVLVTEVEWLRKLLQLDDDKLKPLDRTTLQFVLQTVLEIIEFRFTENIKNEKSSQHSQELTNNKPKEVSSEQEQ